jgi:hypothetical protein
MYEEDKSQSNKRYASREEADRLAHNPSSFAMCMDDYCLEKVVVYFVNELMERQKYRKNLPDKK